MSAIELLRAWGYPEKHFDEIHHSILAHSFSANVVAETLEAKIVQDADRLSSLDHFYTKLFRLTDLLHTKAAKAEAVLRTSVMKDFLKSLETDLV